MNIYRVVFMIGIFSVNSHLLFNFLSSMNPLHFCYLWKLLLNFIFIDFPCCIKWKLIDFSSKIDVAHWADAESKQHTWQLWRPRPSPVQRVVCCVHFPLMFSTSFLFFFFFSMQLVKLCFAMLILRQSHFARASRDELCCYCM